MKISATLALTIITLSLSLINPAHAKINWGDSTSTIAALEAACSSGGGTFTTSGNTATCVVTRPDGTLVIISCDTGGQCFWYTDTDPHVFPGMPDISDLSGFSRPAGDSDHVLAPLDTTPTNPFGRPNTTNAPLVSK